MKLFALIAAAIIAQSGIVEPNPAQIYSAYLPFVARSAATWVTVLEMRGKPFTDAVKIGNSFYISRQDGVIYREGVAWAVVPVNAQGEAGLNALATDGSRLWAGYVSGSNRITVAEITNGTPAVIADFGVAGSNHNAGGLLYLNGVLLFGIGDNTDALSAQDDAKDGGKVWVIDPLTGEKAIAAKGLRNPWHITTIGTSIYIADVGETKYEEANIFAQGANYGWPCFEALEPRVYAPDVCDGLQWTTPAMAYGRDLGRGIVGVAKINGALVYADFAGVVRTFDHRTVRDFGALISKMTTTACGVVVLTFKVGVARAEVLR